MVIAFRNGGAVFGLQPWLPTVYAFWKHPRCTVNPVALWSLQADQWTDWPDSDALPPAIQSRIVKHRAILLWTDRHCMVLVFSWPLPLHFSLSPRVFHSSDCFGKDKCLFVWDIILHQGGRDNYTTSVKINIPNWLSLRKGKKKKKKSRHSNSGFKTNQGNRDMETTTRLHGFTLTNLNWRLPWCKELF